MLRKIGAALLAAGLVLPYGCDVRPITGVWSDLPMVLLIGVPLLVAVAYILHTFIPPLARFHERIGPALHGIFRAVFFGLAGAYLHAGVNGERDAWPFWLAALAFTGTLLYWEQRRGSKVERLPLLMLVIVGLAAVYHFLSALDTGGLQYGGIVLTAGYALAVIAEILDLKGRPTIRHAG